MTAGDPLADWQPRGVDLSTPATARMYDYYLGGKDNYEVDRQAAERLLAHLPAARTLAALNRVFLQRVVRTWIGDGIDQFLDVGCGIPTVPAVHHVAHETAPGARVAYVDHDPVVLTHARAMLADGGSEGRVSVVEGDLRDPAGILASPGVRDFFDWDRPVGILLLAVLHFVTDEDDPRGIMDTLTRAAAGGSQVAVSHSTGQYAPAEVAAGITEPYRDGKASSSFVLRDCDQVGHIMGGLRLVDPGMVPLRDWCPDLPPATTGIELPDIRWNHAAVGMVPRSS